MSRHPTEHTLQPAAKGMENVVASSLRNVPKSDGPVLAWPMACGSVVAERTRAVEFRGGVLRVEVPDAGWKRELQGLLPRYVAALGRYSGQKIEGIEFVVVVRPRES